MTERIAMKNDPNGSLDFIRVRSEKVYWAFLEIVQPKTQQLEEDMPDGNLLTLLSNIQDFIVAEGWCPELDHDLMWFHIFEADEQGNPIKPIIFIVLDFTDEAVYDCSENIKSFTRH
ncbi:hypothetical protein D3C80_1764900 [compost metagenome]